MNTPEIDPTTARERQREADFAEEHSKPTHADEHPQGETIERDESSPEGEGGDGGLERSSPHPL
ncbi:hypothetical protein IU501_10275 [Nocardia otitidiscaviarum]|uniref:hypothetical protein n=1 Tax=Nocardia otitidiscaviarum TaxID=1823 RepID=UPI0004A6D7B9|nr:hypothetical protein [Nocardia otitidiscaviarum]MBF6133384.1 hypothetical protein [Nocardia otitidiscaviarum]MBF6486780.1 hypothetical protein [Nocardia otitidiscaviarum]